MFVNGWIDMPVHDHQIFPAVVVVIQKACAPAQKRNRHLAESGLESHVSKIAGAIIVIQDIRVVGKISDMKIDAAVIVVITNCQSHPCLLATIFVECNAGRITCLFKSSVTFVDVELFWRRVIDDNQIQQVVIVGMNPG